MSDQRANFRLGFISCNAATRDAQGRLWANHSIGRLLDTLRELLPGMRLCIPILPHGPSKKMNHAVNIPPEDVVDLPPLESVISSQRYYFPTRRIVREFARSADVLFMRVPFQLPLTLLGLNTPKVVHVAGNPYNVIQASTDYRGLKKRLALGFASHTCNAMRRMVREPHTRFVTNGGEMWDLLGCREGRVVVSSCLYEREMRPREDLALGNPPRMLFVGYLRPEKGVKYLLDAFEIIRRKRPLKLTLVGGIDKTSMAEAEARARIESSPYRDDITMAGMLDFGQELFELYRNHDVYVLPSLSEGTPRTLVEARSFGCPVVATRAGGIPTSVEDGKTGLLVEPRDSEGLAVAIERILDDEPLRHNLIRAGVEGSKEQTLEYFAGQLVEEIKTLHEQARGNRAKRA